MKRLSIIFLLLLIASATKGQDSTYIWPTNSGRFLSSTFGETRSAHFHAGLDIKTWGREGYEVYATKDGVLSRLLTTNKGYGKAIYLKHSDGYYTVYAHLQRFNEDFQSIADSIRLQDYSYTFEKFLEPMNIEVKKGDIIGFTGSTGIGPPHLHYEIRSPNNQPINPLKSNLAVKDTVAPIFSSLLIEPLEIDSRIYGSVYPQTIEPIEIKNDTTYFNTLFVEGKVGLSPHVYDKSNSVTNKYAVYMLSLVSKQDTLYSERLDQFDFEDSDQMFLNRVSEMGSSKRSFQRLYTLSESSHPFLVKENQNTSFREGRYLIIAEDYYGNSSIAVLPIKEGDKQKKVSPNNTLTKFWGNNWVSINDSTNIDLNDMNIGFVWDSTNNQRLISSVDSPNRTISRIHPHKNYKIVSPDFSLTTWVPKQTFFDTLSIVQERIVSKDSIFIQVGRPETPSKKDIYLQTQLLGTKVYDSRTNLYRVDDDDNYSFVDSWIKGSTLHANLPGLGKFTVLSDTLSPRILRPSLSKLGNGAFTYSIIVRDELSGVDYTTAYFEINGLRGIPEYDYENNSFTFYHPDFKISKENKIRFEIKDRAGNFSSKNFLLKN